MAEPYSAPSSMSSASTVTDSSLSTLSTVSSRHPPNHRYGTVRSHPLQRFWHRSENPMPMYHSEGAMQGEQVMRSEMEQFSPGARGGARMYQSGGDRSRETTDVGSPGTLSSVSAGIQHNWQ